MASANAPRRNPAGSQARKTVKTSVSVDVSLHAKWSAAASLRGMDRNAFAVEAITAATKGIIIIDKSRKHAGEADPSGEEDRPAA
jgi:hypothetical protein